MRNSMKVTFSVANIHNLCKRYYHNYLMIWFNCNTVICFRKLFCLIIYSFIKGLVTELLISERKSENYIFTGEQTNEVRDLLKSSLIENFEYKKEGKIDKLKKTKYLFLKHLYNNSVSSIKLTLIKDSKLETLKQIVSITYFISSIRGLLHLNKQIFRLVPLFQIGILFSKIPAIQGMKIVCREIEREDIGNNFPEVLSGLTELGTIENPTEIYDEIMRYGNYKIFIVKEEENERILGCATLYIEKKFIHSGGSVGHIEDVVVDQSARSKGLGRVLVERCINEAEITGCYKVVLSCSDKNVGFYEKMGMRRKSNEMARYFNDQP